MRGGKRNDDERDSDETPADVHHDGLGEVNCFYPPGVEMMPPGSPRRKSCLTTVVIIASEGREKKTRDDIVTEAVYIYVSSIQCS